MVPGVRTVIDLSLPLDPAALNLHGRPHLLADLGGAQRFLLLDPQKTAGEALRGAVIVDYLKILDAADGEVDIELIVRSILKEFESQAVSEAGAREIVGKLERFVRYKQRLQFPADARAVHTWAEVRERLAKSARSPPVGQAQALVDQMDAALRQEVVNREIERFEAAEGAGRPEKRAK